MGKALIEFTEKLVPISDFSQGKAGKIFNDVAKNNSEYIVLKNNQPTAVLMSLKEYKETQEKVERLERILEYMENIRLLRLAEDRKDSGMTPFETFVKEEGYSMEELKKISESVELE
jgi:prevent-host-death family protein